MAANQFASAKHTIAECDRCGQRYKLRELRETVVRTRPTGLLVCPTCWEPDHPQNMQGMYPVNDPQAVRQPRPDQSLSTQNTPTSSRYIPGTFNPLSGVQSSGTVGTVTVSTS